MTVNTTLLSDDGLLPQRTLGAGRYHGIKFHQAQDDEYDVGRRILERNVEDVPSGGYLVTFHSQGLGLVGKHRLSRLRLLVMEKDTFLKDRAIGKED